MKWEQEFGFKKETILAAAVYASEAKQPMTYLDTILKDYQAKGITTPEQARREHGQKKTTTPTATKRTKVNAQDYEQRDYSEVQDQMMEAQNRRILERLLADGGESDA